MKKLFAILLALVLSLTSAFAVKVTAETIDTPETTKTYEWAIGYAHRCGTYKTKRYYEYKKAYRMYRYARVKHMAKRIALAPLHLMIGVASAESVQIITENGYKFSPKELNFSGEAKKKDRDVRRAQNEIASFQLGNPAMESAKVFGDAILTANQMTGKNVGELGGKHLFEEIYRKMDERTEVRNALIGIRVDLVNNPDNEELIAQKKLLERESEAIKSEIRILQRAVRELLKDCTLEEAVLIKAQGRAAADKHREKREKQLKGRQVNVCPKPILASYKMMSFADMWTASFNGDIRKINDLADKRNKLEYDESASDDEREAATERLQKAFEEAIAHADNYRKAGNRINLDARKAKINNARESQLADVVGVPYGKTTDMIISLSHDVANILSKSVETYIGSDPEKANEKIRQLMEAYIKIGVENGFDMETLPNKQGQTRIVHYKFWNSNNSQLKVGKCVALSERAYMKASLVGHAGMSEEEFEDILCNGSDLLKWNSYATTPGAPLKYKTIEKDEKTGKNVEVEKIMTINDVLVVKSIDTFKKFKNVLLYKEDGTFEIKEVAEIKRTAFDGMIMFLVPIPSQQIRGGFAFKGFGVNCAYPDGKTMVDIIAERENLDIPEYIENVDGEMVRWRDYKAICTADSWKWAGWKHEDESPFSYAEYLSRMNKLAENNPYVNMIYTARIADATEEGKRKLTRQSTQQFIDASPVQIERLISKSVNKIMKMTTHEGVIRKMAGLSKDEDARTAFEHLVEACPEILNHPYMKRAIEDVFNRQVAEAAVRPEVDGIYPYIAEDPVAFFRIVFWGADPSKSGNGYLKGIAQLRKEGTPLKPHYTAQVNVPNANEGQEMYVVRYPNNYLCGMLMVNHNDPIYDCVGNVMVLSVDGSTLVRADGDTDGDEFCEIFTKVVIEMMERTLNLFCPPVVKFPHDSLKKRIIHGKTERAAEISKAIVIANMYGPEVGKNSNLATKFFHNASVAYQEALATGSEKKMWIVKKSLENATVAHIAAIIAIDLAKTGSMPSWLRENLEGIRKYAAKKMPWNQRFCKDNKACPWFSKVWNDTTLEETKDVVDRIARAVINRTNAIDYKAPTGKDFNIVKDLLCSKDGLDVNGSYGKLEDKKFRALEARNYRTKGTNSEGDDEFKFIESLKAGKAVSPTELARFLWRNQASLVYVMQKSGSDKLDNARMQNAYFEFCREILLDFGSVEGEGRSNKRFMSLSEEARHMSNVWKFVKGAFDENNGIGTGLDSEADRELIFSKKASYCLFIVKVFAYDLYQMACERKGIEDVWIKPEASESSDDTDCNDNDGPIDYCLGFGPSSLDDMSMDDIEE